MARIHALAAELDGDRLVRMEVRFEGLARRIVDRDTLVGWMQDGHSLLPPSGRALQLVEVGEARFVRDDHDAVEADTVGGLPSISG